MRLKFIKRYILCALALIIALCGCSANIETAPEAAEQTAAPTLTPEPAPEPTPDYDKMADDAQTAFLSAFKLDTSQHGLPEGYAGMSAFMEDAEQWQRLASELDAAVQGAYKSACGSIGYSPDKAGAAFELSDWRLLLSLYIAFPEEYAEVIKNALSISFEVNENTASARVALPAMYDIINEYGESGFYAVLLYAYANTVYDEHGTEIPYIEYSYPDGWLETLSDPIPEADIKECWYDERDGGKRYHTGTDITAAEGTPILSCSDGAVQFNGTNKGAGNYIAVKDDYGFAFHYYHMVAPSDFLKVGDDVRAGETIGYVGNTGSSSANHLHLTIITPDYKTIDPYTVLRELRDMGLPPAA